MSGTVSKGIDADWQQRYDDMIASCKEAVSRIKPGQRVFIGTGCAHPQCLVRALTERSAELADTEIVHLLTEGEAPYAEKELCACFRVNSLFIGENVREIIQEGLGDYTPIPLFEIPRLFSSGQMPLDAALIQITPPDANGMCSLGISVDIVKSAVENAALVIAEVNPQMPRTCGDSLINIHEVDILVAVDEPLLEVWAPETSEVASRIGEQLAALVEDGSCIEVGIGEIPQAAIGFMLQKKDLGVHTEMFTDSIIDLVESGAVTGSRKNIDRNKIVASFCMGTKKLYDYIDQNQLFSFHPTEYVNDPFIIGSINQMVSINTALEIDLTGQVCADSLGTKFFSGIGGRHDFNLGAARSRGGKAITTLESTAEGGKVSRIVSRLSPGAGVVTTRGDVHYVVTEFGVAYLFGKSIQERAMALISIAHPDYRAQLLREAVELKYIRSELSGLEDNIDVVPQELKTLFLLDDGTQVSFRPVHPTDEPRIRDLFYALSEQSIYYRWMSHLKRLPNEELRNYVYIDHRSQVAIVGTLREAHGEDIIAVGGYYLNPKTNRAEVAFTVRDEWQNRGIGTFLLRHLMKIARRNGIAGFTAEVLRENRIMQIVFNEKSGCQVNSKLEDNVYCFELNFE